MRIRSKKNNCFLPKPLVFILLFFVLSWLGFSQYYRVQDENAPALPENKVKLIDAMHTISSHDLLADVALLCSKKFGGRLTGTSEYNDSAQWVADQLKQAGVVPIPIKDTYFQDFPNPYTLVKESGTLILHIPFRKSEIEKSYQYETQFMPGSTSASGTVKGEVVYVGYGITAPELGYDEYQGVDVKGKIVLMEREVPVDPDKEPDVFKKWRPYSLHQYKVKNAHDHGAAGMLYIYHIANPNCLYIPDFLLTHVGESVVLDLFEGTGKQHQSVVEKSSHCGNRNPSKLGKSSPFTMQPNTTPRVLDEM